MARTILDDIADASPADRRRMERQFNEMREAAFMLGALHMMFWLLCLRAYLKD